MKQNKRFIGITGNIGSGKSEVSSYLIERGYKVIDADKIVREIYQDVAFKRDMVDSFGEIIIADKNNMDLDKKIISNIVFSDKAKLELLNKIIAPFLTNYFKVAKEKISDEIIFFDIPLLFEKGYDKDMDLSLLVYAEDNIRYERAAKRDSKKTDDISLVDKNQMPQDEKLKLADYIIYNNDTKEQLRKKVDEFLTKIGL